MLGLGNSCAVESGPGGVSMLLEQLLTRAPEPGGSVRCYRKEKGYSTQGEDSTLRSRRASLSRVGQCDAAEKCRPTRSGNSALRMCVCILMLCMCICVLCVCVVCVM